MVILYVLYPQNVWLSAFELSLKFWAMSPYVWLVTFYHKPTIYINFVTIDSYWRVTTDKESQTVPHITFLLSYDEYDAQVHSDWQLII